MKLYSLKTWANETDVAKKQKEIVSSLFVSRRSTTNDSVSPSSSSSCSSANENNIMMDNIIECEDYATASSTTVTAAATSRDNDKDNDNDGNTNTNWIQKYTQQQTVLQGQLERNIELQQKQLELQNQEIYRLQQQIMMQRRVPTAATAATAVMVSPLSSPSTSAGCSTTSTKKKEKKKKRRKTLKFSSESLLPPFSFDEKKVEIDHFSLYDADIKSIVSTATSNGMPKL